MLYVKSVKDGSTEQLLAVPLKVQEEYIKVREID